MEMLFLISLMVLIFVVLMFRNIYFGIAIFLYVLAIFNYIFFYGYTTLNFNTLINSKNILEITDILINFGYQFLADLEKAKIDLMIEKIFNSDNFELVDLYNFFTFMVIIYFKFFSNIFATIPFFISRYIKYDLELMELKTDNFKKFFLTYRQIRILKNMFQFHIYFISIMCFIWCILFFNLQF